MKKNGIELVLGLIAILAMSAALCGCDQGAGPSNKDLIDKMPNPPSNNPDIPPVDAKNEEFGGGKKTGN